MSERTLEQALAHADEWEQAQAAWAIYFRKDPALVTWVPDLVLLADEVKRLEDELDRYKDLAS